jgi:hypothetical protein
MNMVLVRPDLQKLHLVALRNLKAYLFQNLINPNGAKLEAIVAKWMAADPEDWGDVMHSTVYRAFGDACRAIGVEINDRQ